jgi:hypothetical protein
MNLDTPTPGTRDPLEVLRGPGWPIQRPPLVYEAVILESIDAWWARQGPFPPLRPEVCVALMPREAGWRYGGDGLAKLV